VSDAPPNILWICTDQQRWDTLGCYGNPFVRTPNLDRLAAGGHRFDFAFCQNPVCTPSRASFLTGRYPRTTRGRQNGQSIPADEIPVTRLLADAGYVCGLSGKLHLSACHPDAHPLGERRIDDGYQVFHWSHHPAPEHPRANHLANAYSLWLRGRGRTFERRASGLSDHVQFGPPEEDHQTTWCADRAIEFIESARAYGRPWLFSFNCFAPHHPFDPPESYLRRYLDRLDAIPRPNAREGEPAEKTAWQRIDHAGAYGGHGMSAAAMTERDHLLVRAAYWAMCDLIDVQVGRMLDALDRTDQRANTIVIFMSDHGELLGDHGLYLKGPHFYEPAVRVPLVVSWPAGAPGGAARGELVELVDLAPTLLEAAGLAVPRRMQGRSLLPLLRGTAGAGAAREDVYCEFYNSNFNYDPPAYATMVRTRDHKLVRYHESREGELYDLRADPGESHNLWGRPGARDVQAAMLARLSDRMARTVDPLPERTAPW
jgi:arylsulfatase A-like enzyme